ncbi:glycosyltransferase [Bacillaceae bacterium IKA-2]|nr:glycosyltransferase [Bacillaceae bacterium IKA-2]
MPDVNSILNQTYANLEIILVNDGSPDNGSRIIEDYAAKDKRVITVHQDNGGLSDARNTGMKFVTGVYTLFVDSDDWLEYTMVEKLVNSIVFIKLIINVVSSSSWSSRIFAS